MILNNFHILRIQFAGATDFAPSRIRIKSERFKQSLTLNWNDDYNHTIDQASDFLHEKGFEIVGMGEGSDGYYIITKTFKPLL